MISMADKLRTNRTIVRVTGGGPDREVEDPELAVAIEAAYSDWKKIRALEEGLARTRALIAARAEALKTAGCQSVSLESGGLRCTVSLRHEALVPEENVPALRLLLGRRFRDLVRTKVRHTATSRLVAEATEDALSLIRLRRLSPQFTWRVLDPDVAE